LNLNFQFDKHKAHTLLSNSIPLEKVLLKHGKELGNWLCGCNPVYTRYSYSKRVYEISRKVCIGTTNTMKYICIFLIRITNRVELAMSALVRVDVEPCRKKLRRKPKNLHAKSQHSSFHSFRDLSAHTDMDRSTRLVILIRNICTYFLRV